VVVLISILRGKAAAQDRNQDDHTARKADGRLTRGGTMRPGIRGFRAVFFCK